MTLLYLGIFAVSLLLSFILTRYVRDLAMARNWLAHPIQDRHLHVHPVPRLGGIAIFVAFLFSVTVAMLLAWLDPRLNLGWTRSTMYHILLPATVVFLLGVYDDIRPLHAYVKFAVQAIAGTMLFAFGLQILDLPVLFGHHHFPWYIGLPVTLAWVLAVTNAFNLIDGLDGLAAGSALFSTLVVFVVSIFSQNPLVSLMSLAMAGAILGFLRYNFNPATIFLGDCGSLFIGFMLAALALRGAQKAPTIIAVAIPVVSFGLPILETALSVLRRFIAGRPVFTADREHIHHKLLERGLSHRQVVIVLYAVSAVFALLSLFLLWPTGSTLGLVLAVLGTGIWLGVQRLGYLEFGELHRVAKRTMEQRQVFVNNLAVRRAIEEFRVARDYPQLCRILVAAFGANDFDSFELRCDLLPGEAPEVHGLEIAAPDGDTRCLHWKKSPGYFASGSDRAWSVTLHLITDSNRECGSMTLYRSYSPRNLQLDINLLTSAFPKALAEALDRSLRPAVQPLPGSKESQAAMAAHAS